MAKFPEYARDFRYTNQVNQSEVFMLLSAPILRGVDPKSPHSKVIIGSLFAEEMYFWHEQGKKITVKINCPGGDVIQGFSIMDAIKETKAKTHNAGIAASMALPIFLAGSERTAMSYSKAMIHAPHYPQGAPKDNLLESMRDSLQTILSECSSYTTEEVSSMLEDNKPDTWLTAEQMYAKKMLTAKPIKSKEKVDAVGVSNEYELHEIFNSLIDNMDNNSEDLKKVQAELTQATAESSAKDAKIAALEKVIADRDAADKQAKQNAATALVEAAIKEKRIPESSKDKFVAMAMFDADSFKTLIESTKPAHTSVMNHIKKDDTSPTGDKKYNDYSGAELVALMDENPKEYDKLYNEHFKQSK